MCMNCCHSQLLIMTEPIHLQVPAEMKTGLGDGKYRGFLKVLPPGGL